MFSPTDTIVAIATPVGRGGIGVVRISGSLAREVAAGVDERGTTLEPRRATLTRVRVDAAVIDRAVVTFFPQPHSYTGEDVVEISAHGSPVGTERHRGVSGEGGRATRGTGRVHVSGVPAREDGPGAG